MSTTKGIIYSEQELVSFLKENNKIVFDYLFDNYSGSLFIIINKITGDFHTSEDVLQDVFVKIWGKMGLYDSQKGAFFTWMRTIASNTAIDSLRSSGEMIKRNTHSENAPDNVFARSAEQIDLIGVTALILKLRPQFQIILKLIYLEGFTIKEVATKLKIPEGTVKTRLRVSLKSIKNSFQYLSQKESNIA
ncbi:RNA polymerase subunit sigma-70 [Flavipsychrobacter stenotrophus]|uniref:RNA polymerase subunit sigma-70 n=1 Tax=Flavipsychrobacter stenotrophus TaxID=2077091 RepID=A0A2S7SQB6_9BACT|nr:RNA polymerase sigma factor [Flavipsychrobacter stenotrophus]PQJ09080.1 RNA polymerase subunit sigma-70 [Flavipsychrobacter stenotrophus]